MIPDHEARLSADVTRRRLLQMGLALPLAMAACADDDRPGSGGGPGTAEPATETSAPLAATPACGDGDEPTPDQTEGPYFKPRSPRRQRLVEAGTEGRPLLLTGTVLTTDCRPVPRALLDFWQADARGTYDNAGFRLRGHQFADARGAYRLETVVPGLYPSRTRHIHVKVQPRGGDVLTSQLYFPGEPRNRVDGIFDEALLVRLARRGARWVARLDFVLQG